MPRTVLKVRPIDGETAQYSIIVSRGYDLDADTVEMIRGGDLVPGVSSPTGCLPDKLASEISALGRMSPSNAEQIAKEARQVLRSQRDYLSGRVYVRKVL